METFAYMDDLSLGLIGITANTISAFAFLRRESEDIGIVVNTPKTVALPPKCHAPTTEEILLLESVDVRLADEGGVAVVHVPIGSVEYALERARETVKERGTDHLARCLDNKSDKQAEALIVMEPLGQKTGYLERALDTELSLEACKWADNGAQWACEKIRALPGAAEAQSFCQGGCPDGQLTLQPHQQAQAHLSTGAGGLGLHSAEARRMSASIGSTVGIVPEVLTDLTGPLGDRARRGLPESRIIAQLGGSLRGIRTHGG